MYKYKYKFVYKNRNDKQRHKEETKVHDINKVWWGIRIYYYEYPIMVLIAYCYETEVLDISFT